jgi:hypothetical protein
LLKLRCLLRRLLLQLLFLYSFRYISYSDNDFADKSLLRSYRSGYVLAIRKRKTLSIEYTQGMVNIIFLYLFSHPDYTVGSGIPASSANKCFRYASHRINLTARGLYRRWGIAPRPEEQILILYIG